MKEAQKMDKKVGKVEEIRKFILENLKDNGPQRRSSIIKNALQALPTAKPNTIETAINSLNKDQEISRIEKGVWGLCEEIGIEEKSFASATKKAIKRDEPDFYSPFADWLVREVGECSCAIPLGGSSLKDYWGTPDVIGIYRVSDRGRYRRDQIVSFVSAEVKRDKSKHARIEAFGQACAYLLFSHKVYLVLPRIKDELESERLESLCEIVGLGLVLFNPDDKDNPEFEIRIRPLAREPDAEALNKILERDDIYKKLR
jgi:hypothetical protein